MYATMPFSSGILEFCKFICQIWLTLLHFNFIEKKFKEEILRTRYSIDLLLKNSKISRTITIERELIRENFAIREKQRNNTVKFPISSLQSARIFSPSFARNDSHLCSFDPASSAAPTFLPTE